MHAKQVLSISVVPLFMPEKKNAYENLENKAITIKIGTW